ncbi:hypothetical protein MMC34_006998 [Xylographa carneopallida]|nr:hypothetical protein [Xylographa carneopallida]
MGKKRGHPDAEEILSRPWCYYCERDFGDLKILINHQKAKHFKCERCGRRLNTAGGLSVHMTQVHKETLTTIENALPNRSNLDVEIFGMEGIPDDVVSSHNQRVLSQFAQAEAERRAATGNPGPGGVGAGAVKKPKIEEISDIKKRLAEHKAKKAAEQAVGISSGDATPIDGGHGSPGLGAAYGQNPSFAGSPPFQPQMPYGGPQNGSTYASYPQTYGQSGMPFQQPQVFPQQSPGFGSPPIQQYPQHQAFPPPQQYPTPGNPNFAPPQFHNGPQAQFSSGPPRSFGAGSPPIPFHQQPQYQPPRTQTPPQPLPLAMRSGSLPTAPGLPQRPSFGAPPVNAFQMQQMHQGQIPGPSNPSPMAQQSQVVQHALSPHVVSGTGLDVAQTGSLPQPNSQAQNAINAAPSVAPAHASQPTQDKSSTLAITPDLPIPEDSSKITTFSVGQTEAKAGETQSEKKSKKEKEKDKDTRMVYSDNETSPEEKMAKLSRYAFNPEGKEDTVLGDANTAAVTGVDRGYDAPYDKE